MDVDISVPRVIPAFHNDPFSPVLYASTPVEITREQEDAIRTVLLLSSSDTRFAQKAADSLRLILGGGLTAARITSLEPASKPINSPSFKLKCKGTDFVAGSIIYVNGNPMPTTFTSATEVSTDVSLVGIITPTQYPVNVKLPNGVVTNTMMFTVTAI